MSIDWQRKHTPYSVLHGIDARGIIPRVRIWLLEREDLTERERYEMQTVAVKAYKALKKTGQAPWEAWGDGYDPPELGITVFCREWIHAGPNPEIPAVRPPLGDRYFLRKTPGNRRPGTPRTWGRVFLIKHNLHEPPNTGGHAAQRLKYKAAHEAWKVLSEEEKNTWRRHSYAKAFHLTGYCTFISFHTRGKI